MGLFDLLKEETEVKEPQKEEIKEAEVVENETAVNEPEKEVKEEPKKETGDSSFEKKMLRSVIIAVSHIIYLNDCFKNNLQDNASASIRRAK